MHCHATTAAFPALKVYPARPHPPPSRGCKLTHDESPEGHARQSGPRRRAWAPVREATAAQPSICFRGRLAAPPQRLFLSPPHQQINDQRGDHQHAGGNFQKSFHRLTRAGKRCKLDGHWGSRGFCPRRRCLDHFLMSIIAVTILIREAIIPSASRMIASFRYRSSAFRLHRRPIACPSFPFPWNTFIMLHASMLCNIGKKPKNHLCFCVVLHDCM